jgi:2-methylcitrate dehydratase PrpD
MVDGRALTLAYLVGFEVSASLGAALNPEHYARGWHATATLGTLGATAAAARLLGLEAEETRHALGIAASLASGLKENFGSMTKPYHAGHAARNGVLAATLAREGFSASPVALEGPQGFAQVLGGSAPIASAVAGLGERWHLLATGIAVKPYPSCALTHATIDALLELRARHGIGPESVAGVEVGVHPTVPGVLIHPDPATPLERKFSMQYCAAAALADGRVDLRSFEDGEIPPAIRRLMPRVTMVVEPELPARPGSGRDAPEKVRPAPEQVRPAPEQAAWSRVTLRLEDGSILTSPARGARGHPDQPLTGDELLAKFLACASRALPLEEAGAVAAQIGHLDEIPDIRALTSRLAAGAD